MKEVKPHTLPKFAGWKEFAEKFRTAYVRPLGDRQREIVILAEELRAKLLGTDNVFGRILEASLKLTQNLLSGGGGGIIAPVHIHFECDHNFLAVPWDIAFGSDTGDSHVCHDIPFVWRIDVRGNPETLDVSRTFNPIDYTGFQAISSCDEDVILQGQKFAKAGDMPKSAAAILNSLPRHGGHVHVCDRNGLVAQLQSRGDGAYFLSHGIDAHPGDLAGMVVGPIPGNGAGDSGEVVNAGNLGAANVRKRFLHWNCCELGSQQTDARQGGSYYGGFLEGILANACSVETICNRWGVTFEGASLLAVEFYKLHPITAYGRAHALVHARRAVRNAVLAKSPEKQNDPTWLAPIHVWART
jgi:hypothetical protein